ncbi:TIM barrel protein [Micromonospora sp. M12]
MSPQSAWDRLVAGCATVVDAADTAGVTLGFEPEPGMLVQDIADWRRLHAALGAPARFGITLDIGHCRCLEPWPVPQCVAEVAEHLVNVQIDDMRRGVHEHLEFGVGEIDFPPVLAALSAAGYGGLVAVELPRDSHAAPPWRPDPLIFCAPRRPPRRPMVAVDPRCCRRPLLCFNGRNGDRPVSGHRPSRGVKQSKDAPEHLRSRTAARGRRRDDTGFTTAALRGVPDPDWLDTALRRVTAEPTAITRLFPAVGRRCGRDALPDAPAGPPTTPPGAAAHQPARRPRGVRREPLPAR